MVRRSHGQNGLLAWKRLHEKLRPRTLASGVKAISQVLSPTQITNATRADSYIEAWEEKMKKLAVEYGETLTNKMKLAVLYGMLPKELQERALD